LVPGARTCPWCKAAQPAPRRRSPREPIQAAQFLLALDYSWQQVFDYLCDEHRQWPPPKIQELVDAEAAVVARERRDITDWILQAA
jgi:hypothetical protein